MSDGTGSKKENEIPGPEKKTKNGSILYHLKKEHPDCPKCSLPMSSNGDGIFFCPSCDGSYNTNGESLKTVSSSSGKTTVRIVALIISLAVVASLVVAGFGVYSFIRKGPSEPVDIEDVSRIRDLTPTNSSGNLSI